MSKHSQCLTKITICLLLSFILAVGCSYSQMKVRKHVQKICNHINKGRISKINHTEANPTFEKIFDMRFQAIPPLRNLLLNSNETTRFVAAIILGLFNDKQAIPVLIDFLSNQTVIQFETEDTRFCDMAIIRLSNCVVEPSFGEEKGGFVKDKEKAELAIKQWQEWWQENKDYLYFDRNAEPYGHYVIDEEAKKAGIPTEEYRKTYPWPNESKSDKPK